SKRQLPSPFGLVPSRCSMCLFKSENVGESGLAANCSRHVLTGIPGIPSLLSVHSHHSKVQFFPAARAFLLPITLRYDKTSRTSNSCLTFASPDVGLENSERAQLMSRSSTQQQVHRLQSPWLSTYVKGRDRAYEYTFIPSPYPTGSLPTNLPSCPW